MVRICVLAFCDSDGSVILMCPTLPGLITHGDSLEEALGVHRTGVADRLRREHLDPSAIELCVVRSVGSTAMPSAAG